MRSTLENRLNRMNNLQQRIIAAIVGAATIIAAIYWSEWTYFLVFFFICMFSQLEFYKLLGLDGNIPLKFFGTFCGVSIYTLTFLIEKGLLPARFYMLIFPIVSVVFFIKLYKKELKPFTNIAFTFLGIVYVGLPFAMLNLSVFYHGYYSYQIILGSILLLWASDTGAYFAGVNFGRHKLFERVSPKKSWEGSVGGAVAAIGVAFILATVFHELEQWQWLCIACIIIVAGTYGDLVESLFKRSIAIKDSGSSIPGHGGFLDRFDGLLLAAPFIAAFLNLF
jgi:phosphatidate cytidylyltransferase